MVKKGNAKNDMGCGLCGPGAICQHRKRWRFGRRSSQLAPDMMTGGPAKPGDGCLRIALVGNPNVGKSVVFSYLTGKYAVVSNYPGTTVELSQGRARWDDCDYEITDTPGVNSLTPMSEDELVTRDWLLHNRPEAVLLVADAKNMRRTVLLALQLAETGLPLVMALNMLDECRGRGISIDHQMLARELDMMVLPTVAVERQGLEQLRQGLAQARPSELRIDYGPQIESFIEMFCSIVGDAPLESRSLALMFLGGDQSLEEWIEQGYGRQALQQLLEKALELRTGFNRPLDYVISEKRLRLAEDIVAACVVRGQADRSAGEWLGEMATRPLTGIPLFLLVLYLVFKFVGQFGAGTLVDFTEEVIFEGWLLPLVDRGVNLLPWPLLIEALMGDYGLISMGLTYAISIVLPIVGTFFLAFGFLEDSGYLPRLSVMANRVFRLVGLSGKAVLPMVLGLGCTTMATLTTRILDSRKERIIATLLMALGIPCSAQLGVMLGMLSWMSPSALFFVAGVVGLQLLLVGRLASVILPGERSDFIQELPPIRWPQPSNIVFKTLARMRWFLIEAVPFFLLGTLLLFLLDISGALSAIAAVSAPVVSGMLGLPERAVDFFILGFMRRDYGAAGLFDMARSGLLSRQQMVVSLITLTLFVPCVANFFVIIKERGLATALMISGFIFPFAIFIGWLSRLLLATGIVPM